MALAVINNYEFDTKMIVSGVAKRQVDEMRELVASWVKKNVLIKDEGESFTFECKKPPSGLRGTQERIRVDIQGPMGSDHVRIAFQIDRAVNAQVAIPINKPISKESFLEAFEQSANLRQGAIFAPELVGKAEAKSPSKRKGG